MADLGKPLREIDIPVEEPVELPEEPAAPEHEPEKGPDEFRDPFTSTIASGSPDLFECLAPRPHRFGVVDGRLTVSPVHHRGWRGTRIIRWLRARRARRQAAAVMRAATRCYTYTEGVYALAEGVPRNRRYIPTPPSRRTGPVGNAPWTLGPAAHAQAILDALACGRSCTCRLSQQRGYGKTHSPLRSDSTPSLNVTVRDGKVLVHDHGNGAQGAVLDALREGGLWPGDAPASPASSPASPTAPASSGVPDLSGLGSIPLPSSPSPNGPAPPPTERRWHMRAPDGRPVVHVRRDPGKHFHWELEDGRPTLNGISPKDLLYQPEPLDAHPDEDAVLCEGEKAGDAIHAAGLLVGATVCGAPKVPSEEALRPFAGRTVTLFADNDEVGRKQMAGAAEILAGLGCTLKQVHWPEAPEHGDAADTTPAEIRRLVASARLLPASAAADHVPAAVNFWSHDGFIPKRVVDYLERECPIQLGEDGRLYRYVGGVHQLDAETWIAGRMSELLAERWRKRLLEEVKVLSRARHPTLPMEPSKRYLNLPNGLLDWRAGELHPHSPDVPSMIRIPVAWRPDATCPGIDKFLSEVLPPDVVPMIYELFGYALYAGNPFQKAVLLLGPGGNGKGQLLHLFTSLCGRRNCSACSLHDLSEDRFAKADLYGRLANVCGDLDARNVERSDIFKQLTGGDAVRAERKFGQPFTFISFALPIFSANESPPSSDQTAAYFDRWLIVPMPYRFRDTAGEVQEIGLKLAAQREEMEGLLVKAVEGLRRLMERGHFEIPHSVREAGEKYRQDLDSVLGFIKECYRFHSAFWTDRTKFYNAYKDHSFNNGRRPLSSKNVYEKIRNTFPQITETLRNGYPGFNGLGLIRDVGRGSEEDDDSNSAPAASQLASPVSPLAPPTPSSPQSFSGLAPLCPIPPPPPADVQLDDDEPPPPPDEPGDGWENV